ncbi:MAG TPA: MauE/DoxX family redox-associated membrane protein [Pirellulaceae bacterium]|jgi:uncharacterized membrane protein YphA (DoxX/SURF4 family)|nr:MauE/DoxX family redox-associated membrane protein [Pirellulaceae bacterium]
MRRVALVLIGLVLIAAGIAKILALSGPVDSLGWPREMIVAGSAVELLLGAWLLSGAATRLAHLAAIGVFLLFAVLSAYQVLRGVPSCGCLGKLYVPPAWMLGFDLLTLGVLGTLWFVADRRNADEGKGSAAPIGLSRGGIAMGMTLAAALVLLAGASAWALAGSWEGSLGLASGRDVLVSPEVVDLGAARVGEQREGTVRLVNATSRPIRVVGGKNSCGCLVTGELPLTLPAYGDVEFPIVIAIQTPGYREVVFHLFTDHPEQRVLQGRVRYEAEPANEVALAPASP